MAHVRVLMMQKDENEQLSRWLEHYSSLFGIKNITIMDNGSTSEYTINLLKSAELGGATVMRGYDTQHDFQNKGGHFNNIIKSWDAEYDYDFALPVDCDEIIAAFSDDGISVEPSGIHAVLDSLKEEKRPLRLDMSLFNVPNSPGWFTPIRHFHKGFVPAKTLEGIDNGQHAPWTKYSHDPIDTPLTYLHFHNRPYHEVISRNKLKLSDIVDTENREALLKHLEKPLAPGAHLIEALLTPECEYYSKYDSDLKIFVPNFPGKCAVDVGAGWIEWDSKSYLILNPDVSGYNLGPLHHYLRYGFLEGRALHI